MSNDELYYDDLTDLAARVAQGIQNRTQPLDALTQTLNQLIGTDTIKGLGADSMKAYVSEVHLPLIQTFQLALNNYQMALGKYVKGYLDVDSDAGFKLIREDLEDHQTKLTTHRSDYTDLAEQLKSLSDEASSIVSLGGAGSSYLNKVADKMDDMKKTAKDLLESWDNYEQTDPGFAQVQELLARTRDLIKSALNVPGGYSYSPGSFSGLMSAEFLAAYQANLSYATDVNNQNEFSKNWESIMNEYGADQQRLEEAAAKKKAQEEGLFGLLWDGLQIAAGAVMVATGVGAPLGVVLIAGGVNSAINHASMAITGKGFNLVGMASENIGKWYNSSLGKALGQDGAGGIVNGIFQGAGEMVSGMAQMSVYDIGKGVNTLFTNGEARQQMFDGIGSWWNQLCTGDSVAIGKTVFNVASIFVGGAEVKGAAQIAKASSAEGLLAKSGVFIKALGQTTVKNAVETGKMFKNLPGNLKNGAERFSTKVYDSRFAASMREVLGNPRVAFAGVGDGRSLFRVVSKPADGLPKEVQRDFAGMSAIDKAKLDRWKHKPSHKDYLEHKAVYDDARYFNQETGEPIYPGMNGDPNVDGFVNGEYFNEILQPGDETDLLIGRRGSTDGKYFAPAGTPFDDIALPPFMENEPEILYKVCKPLPVKAGEVAPWFGKNGGGTQYLTDFSAGELIDAGYLKPIIP
ncbi:glycohydrolase toxin TNT-related protein [Lactovum odontotermitis]